MWGMLSASRANCLCGFTAGAISKHRAPSDTYTSATDSQARRETNAHAATADAASSDISIHPGRNQKKWAQRIPAAKQTTAKSAGALIRCGCAAAFTADRFGTTACDFTGMVAVAI